jgi:hypothetical protein
MLRFCRVLGGKKTITNSNIVMSQLKRTTFMSKSAFFDKRRQIQIAKNVDQFKYFELNQTEIGSKI